eukprot:TRINITY_DN1115_c0_g1_i1.p1 TRINITY_DN1115_c0_g1~~TRINITY_DN1115_c0_g1_i1.p1  ORF type:complete len:446 (+),score=66.28 TRINITY_DN1115_c0_g1_i1:49-1338(+)
MITTLLHVVTTIFLFNICKIEAQCQGSVNTNPIYTTPPVLLNTSQDGNGKLYITGGDSNPVKVLHLYGTPYEMGYAQGELLGDEILSLYTQFWGYLDEFIAPYVKDLPYLIQNLIETFGVQAALEAEVVLTELFVPQHFEDEIRGLADALQIEFAEVMKIMLFPELIKAQCSIVGAWGNATQSHGLLQLRALDWGTDNPFVAHPLLTVYHPLSDDGHPYATLGWTGFIGALTGFSTHVGASQKVWVHYNGTDSRAGIPWTFLFRDILQYAEDVNDALKMIDNSQRTCSVFLGLGDHSTQTARVVEYSLDTVSIFNDTTPFPGYAPSPPEHPIISDVVYVDKVSQPSTDPCLADLLQKYYGNMTSSSFIDVVSLFRTGDMHIAIYDYLSNDVYISVADQTQSWPASTTPAPAYNRTFIYFDMDSMFNMPQ